MASTLGDKLGALLFQLPPNLKKDLPLLEAFVAELPPRAVRGVRVPASVLARRRCVRACWRRRNLALCVADSEKLSTPVRITADYAYFRLRDEGYTPDDIGAGLRSLRARPSACRDVYVYFKHEEEGKGPEFAKLLMENLGLTDAEDAEDAEVKS